MRVIGLHRSGQSSGGVAYYTPNVGLGIPNKDYANDAPLFDMVISEDVTWYLWSDFNVPSDEMRTDQELFIEAFTKIRKEHLDEIRQRIQELDGHVEYLCVLVFRDAPPESQNTGEYSAGIVVPLKDLFADNITENTLFRSGFVQEHPKRAHTPSGLWYITILDSHFSQLGNEKTRDTPD